MAEKTNVGMAVFVADNPSTCMCGFGSDGAAALLYACSLIRCCSNQFVLMYCFRALCAISCNALSGHSVNIDSLHIYYADIFISQVRAAGGSGP